MEKVIEMLKQRAWSLAVKELENVANSFSFSRYVPEYAQQLEDAGVGEEAYVLFTAFVLTMVQRYPDGRCEDSIRMAKKIVANGLGLDDPAPLKEVEMRVIGASMHPTVMQQAAQLAFYFLDTCGAVPEEIKVDTDYKTWWRMPLI